MSNTNAPTTDLPLITGLKALMALGARTVVTEYSGSGDSGGIDSTTALGEGGEVPIPDTLKAALEEWMWRHAIPHSGWENNEGAHGTVTIDLATLEVTGEHVDHVESEGEAVTTTDVVTEGPLHALLTTLHEAGHFTNDALELEVYLDGNTFQAECYGWSTEFPELSAHELDQLDRELVACFDEHEVGDDPYGGGGTATFTVRPDGTFGVTATSTVTVLEDADADITEATFEA